MKIALGCDHAGHPYKEQVLEHLQSKHFEVKDFGTYSDASCDYADFAHPVASAVEKGEFQYGILMCGSANGVAITANKHQGIRAGLAWNKEVAMLVKAHNNANILCIPARFVSVAETKEIIDTFFHTTFEGGRHQKRIEKIPC